MGRLLSLRSLIALAMAALLITAAIWLWSAEVGTRRVALRTMQLAACVAVCSVGWGLLLAIALFRTRVPLRRAALLALTALLFIPLYVQASAWKSAFAEWGWYTVGTVAADSAWLNGFWAAVWVHTLAALPWAVWLTAIGLLSGRRDVEEAALLEAAPWHVLRYITLPSVLPWALVAAIWIAVLTAGELTITDAFLVDTTARQLYLQFAAGRSLWDALWYAAGPSLITALLVLLMFLIVACSAPRGFSSWSRRALVFPFGRWHYLASAFVWLSVSLLLVPTLASLLWQAGLTFRADAPPQWTVQRAARVLAAGGAEFFDEIRWTLMIGSLAASLAVIMAITLLLRIARRSRTRLAPLAWLLVLLSLAIPGPLIGLLLIHGLNHPQLPWLADMYDRSVLGPVLASLIRAWPVVAVLVWFTRRGIAEEVGDLSELEGVGRWTRLRCILLPLSSRALIVAWLAALAISAGELAATLLVVPPGVFTVATRVFGLIHSGVREKEAAICLWHVLICLVVTGFVTRAGNGWLPQGRQQ